MKPFTGVAVVILALIAVLQLVRFVLAFPVSINGMNVPTWPSLVAFIVLGGVALMVWREQRAGR